MKKSHLFLFLAAVLLFSFGLKLNHLGHRRFGSIDECCHALVAKNLLKHPLKPTLIDVPYSFYEEALWSENHIWLHKPILPLWQSAFSYWLLGVTPFALRLPSAILSTFAVWLTYLIGTQLLTRRAACIAAGFQAFSWFIMRLTQGYQFSDAIDISLLFYCELGIYGIVRAVKTRQWRFVLLAGIGQGLAFLSKTYPAFIVAGVALAAWLAPHLGLAKKEDCHLRGQHILGMLAVTALVAGPWMLYTAIQYPIEFKIEHGHIFKHLIEDIETWGAPWYKIFLYNADIFNMLTFPVLIAVCWNLPRLFQKRHLGICLLYAWGFGVLIPFLLAVTKTPSATIIGMPAFLLIFSDFAARTTRPTKNSHETRRRRGIRKTWRVLLGILFLLEIHDAWWITNKNVNDKTLAETANFVETALPKNAVLLTEIDEKNVGNHCEHLYLMFQTSHTAHVYRSENMWKPLSRQVRRHGGIPYIVTFRELDLPVLFKSEIDGRTVYSMESSGEIK